MAVSPSPTPTIQAPEPNPPYDRAAAAIDWRLNEATSEWKPGVARPLSSRLISLDAFRGLTVMAMLLVNNVALDSATPQALTHAPWNGGVYFADMVFPWFLLIVGVAVPFALASHRGKGLGLGRYCFKALNRAMILVLLGCFIDSSLIQRPVFGLGVLQLIGLGYLVGTLFYFLPVLPRLAVSAGLLLAHWALIRFLPIPGVGAGVFTEQTNVINHLNQVYLLPLSLKGLLSLVPVSALVLIGTTIGDTLRSEITAGGKVIRLFLGGAALVGVGWLWNLDLPFNKPVWTASYVLYAGGWGTVVLAFLYLGVDVWKSRWWAYPLVVSGSNAILAYVAPILVKIYILQTWKWPMPQGSPLPLQQALLQYCCASAGRVPGGWIYTVSYLFFWWLVLFCFYRKRIYLRV